MAARRTIATFSLAALVVVPALAGCGKDEKSKSDGAASSTVQVLASGTACEVSNTALAAGPTTFDVKNKGSETTEVYVYGADGDEFSKVINEVENIGPGTAREMKVDLAAGTYEVACKPGQKGDGIRTKITVTGAGGAVVKAADREVEFSTLDFRFDGLTSLAVKTGETIKFEMNNRGPAPHEFEVFGPDGAAIGEIGPTKKGKQADVTFTFDKPGAYTYVCDVDDHQARGMKGAFTVG